MNLSFETETDIEDNLLVTKGEGRGWGAGINWEPKISGYKLLYIK